MQAFQLDPQIERDTSHVAELRLCALRLMRDATYPWLVLVPRRAGAAELIDLERDDRLLLMDEIALVSEALRAVARPDKLNVAAIGNLVRQLHVHVVARRRDDPAWPKPVWGFAPPRPYDPDAERDLIASLAARLPEAERTG